MKILEVAEITVRMNRIRVWSEQVSKGTRGRACIATVLDVMYVKTSGGSCIVWTLTYQRCISTATCRCSLLSFAGGYFHPSAIWDWANLPACLSEWTREAHVVSRFGGWSAGLAATSIALLLLQVIKLVIGCDNM